MGIKVDTAVDGEICERWVMLVHLPLAQFRRHFGPKSVTSSMTSPYPRSLFLHFFSTEAAASTRMYRLIGNKWRGVTISLRTGGQGHPTPIHTQIHPQHSNIQKKYRKRSFSHFSTRWPPTDGPTDQRTDGRTDKASYRVACPQLKTTTRSLFQTPWGNQHIQKKQFSLDG